MKRRLLLTVGVLILVVVIAFLVFSLDRGEDVLSGEPGRTTGPNDELRSTGTAGKGGEILEPRSSPPNGKDSWMPTEEEQRRWEQTEAIFYGRVIDQHGDPVPNVDIRYAPTHQAREGLYETFFTRADANGRFTVRRSNAPGLRIAAEAPAGYYPTSEQSGTFDFSPIPPSLPPALRKFAVPHHRADPANPVIFKLKKMGPTEPLIYWRQSRVLGKENEFGLAPDPGHRLLLKFWVDPVLKRTDPISQMPFYNWGCEISVPNGGILARTNPEAFDAPVDGYTDQIRFDYPAEMDARDYKLGINREFFLKFNDGRFARIEVSMDSRPRRPFATIVSWFNPSGSRSTEFDESKQIELPAPR